MRVSRLADDLPEVTELDLNPVIARRLGAVAESTRGSGSRLRSRKIHFYVGWG